MLWSLGLLVGKECVIKIFINLITKFVFNEELVAAIEYGLIVAL